MGGFQVSRYEGTYTINAEENQITFSFDTEHTENAALSPGLTSLGERLPLIGESAIS